MALKQVPFQNYYFMPWYGLAHLHEKGGVLHYLMYIIQTCFSERLFFAAGSSLPSMDWASLIDKIW